nr:MAG TPA: hypothetical protein [Bacteriophage sp.]
MDWIRLIKAIGITILIAIQLGIIVAATDNGIDDDIGDICTIILIIEFIIVSVACVVGFIYWML